MLDRLIGGSVIQAKWPGRTEFPNHYMRPSVLSKSKGTHLHTEVCACVPTEYNRHTRERGKNLGMNDLDGGEIAGSDSTNPTLANTNVRRRGFVTAPKMERSLLQ